MKKTYKIKGMHCNSCSQLIVNSLKDKVNLVSVSYSTGKAEIDFDPENISEKEINEILAKHGYSLNPEGQKSKIDYTKWTVLGVTIIFVIVVVAYILKNFSISLPEISLPQLNQNTSLILIFVIGILTGFHCISMCGGFVLSYTTKNALNGHKSFTQHLAYGGSKVISYTIIGAAFGLIGGIFAFSTKLRGTIAILAGVFMIFYALSMFGIGFFKKFQFNPKFLTRAAAKAGSSAKGPYKAPIITGLLNGLFIACGPLQAMYLYAAGTGSAITGAASLAVFGLGTLPVMLGFGSLATVISYKTTKTILRISAVIVLILGIIMISRGLSVMGYSINPISATTSAGSIAASVTNGVQTINMDVDASGYHPNSFVLKQGVPVKWNINVKELTSCNQEIIVNAYKIDIQLHQGLNTLEFTPDKTGAIQFSCGMGMLHGSFIVTETGTASQQQVQSATPAKGMQCGGSSSGGCGCMG